MIGEFQSLPTGAKRLIVYYTIAITDTLTLFEVIYMFSLGFQIAVIGLLYSYLFLVTGLARFIVGRLIDLSLPPKYMIVISELLNVGYWIILYWARSPRDFLMLYSLSAVMAIFSTAYRSIERDLYPEDRLEVTYKHHMFWPYFAQFFVVMGYGYLLQIDFVVYFRLLVLFVGFISFLRAVYVLLFIPKTRVEKTQNSKYLLGNLRSVPLSLLLVMFAEILVFMAFGVAPSFVLDNYLYNVIGISVFGIAIIYSLGGLLGAVSVFLYGFLEKSSNRCFLYGSLSAFSLGALVMYFAQYTDNPYLLIFIVMAIVYMFWSIWWMIHESTIMKLIPENLRGTIFGLLSTIELFVAVPLPVLASIIMGWNPLAPYIFQAALFMLAIPIYELALRRMNQ